MFESFIPSKENKKYSAQNQSDLFGNLVRTRNMDFNKKGYASLARKPYVFYTETQDVNFSSPIGIFSDENEYYVITSDEAFRTDGDGATIMTNGTPPNFGFQSDGCFFTADLHASGTTTVCSYNLAGDTWTSRITGLSSSYPHPLCVSEHQAYLAVGNGNVVKLYNAAYANVENCTLPAAQIVTWIRWRGNLLYIGCRNIFGGEAKVYIWNGSGTAAQNGYGVGCEWAMSGCEYGTTIVIITVLGQLLQFSGDGFTPLQTNDGVDVNLPIYYNGISWGSGASNSNLVSKVASRGMIAKGRRIFLMIDGELGTTTGGTPRTLVDMPSGLWVFDPEVGLYHKAGLDHKQRQKLLPSSVASDILTLPSAVVYETGDAVSTNLISGLTGDIRINTIYYAIKIDSTHIKLAVTPQQAQAGQAITITGTPGPLDQLIFNVYQSVGATMVTRAGPVALVNTLSLPRYIGSEVVYGGETRNSLGASIGVVMSLGMGKNVGSFVIPKVQASAVTDVFKKLIAKFPPLNTPSRRIIVKYRTANRWGVPGRRVFTGSGFATWITSTTFSINPKEYDFYSVQNGDEIEFCGGAAAGYTAHITNIAQTSSTLWTITIDETMPDVLVGDTSEIIIDNWTKYKVISRTLDSQAALKGFKNMTFTKNAKWVQLKVELRGYTDIEETIDMEELAVINGADQKYA